MEDVCEECGQVGLHLKKKKKRFKESQSVSVTVARKQTDKSLSCCLPDKKRKKETFLA